VNLLYRCTKHTTHQLRLACNSNPPACVLIFFLLNPNFHIIQVKKNKNKSGHFQGTQGIYLRLVRMTSVG
jgi:hypothetical protein